jgi:hypothetical protein
VNAGWLQGIVNTDSRFIAVPDSFVNLIPTVSCGFLSLASDNIT